MEPDKDTSPVEQQNNINDTPDPGAPPAPEKVDGTAASDTSAEAPAADAKPDETPATSAPLADVTPPASSPATPPAEQVSEDPAAPTEGTSEPQIVAGGVGSSAGGAVFSSGGPTGGSSSPKRKLNLKWVIVAVVILVVVLGGGYVFAFYLPNTPSNVYKSGLTNTGKAADKLVDYMKQEQTKSYKSFAFDGNIDVKSGSGSGDATFSGALDKTGNGTLSAKIDIAGEHLQVNGRSIVAKGNTTPDLYVQTTGIKSMLDNFGLSSLDSLDGKWISIDHTLIDTYEKNLSQGFTSGLNNSGAGQMPTASQMISTVADVQTVNKQYIFTTDSKKAVLTNQKFLGKETKDGRSVDHYRVGYDKAHLQAYVAALKTTLDSSALNSWSKKANDGKSLSEFMDWSDLEKSVKNAKSGYTFDVWVDTKTKLINTVQFTDMSNSSTKFSIGQNYTGGSSYPLTLGFSDKDSSGNPETGTFTLTVDTNTHKYTGGFSVTTKGSSAADVSGKFSLTPGNTAVQVTVPKNAESINDLIAQLGLFGAGVDSSAAPNSSALLL